MDVLLTVRKVVDELMRALKRRAVRPRRSVILEQARKPHAEAFKARMRRRREGFAGRDFSDNTEIVRRMRGETS